MRWLDGSSTSFTTLFGCDPVTRDRSLGVHCFCLDRVNVYLHRFAIEGSCLDHIDRGATPLEHFWCHRRFNCDYRRSDDLDLSVGLDSEVVIPLVSERQTHFLRSNI